MPEEGKHLISATITPAAFEIRSRWPGRQKSAHISRAIIFYHNHGPNNLDGMYHENQKMVRNIIALQRRITTLTETVDGPKS